MQENTAYKRIVAIMQSYPLTREDCGILIGRLSAMRERLSFQPIWETFRYEGTSLVPANKAKATSKFKSQPQHNNDKMQCGENDALRNNRR